MSRPILFAAPHRLPFLVGTANLLALAGWWLAHLAALLPPGPVPAGWLHGPAMLLLIFPPFVFGFLLTVFPRWMGQPDLTAGAYGLVGTLLAAASAVAQAGVWTAQPGIFAAGIALEAAAWLGAIGCLARVLLRHEAARKPRCWHAWSALLALALGLIGAGLAGAALATTDAALAAAAIRLLIGGFLAPVFLTVAHRMVPFFAGNVVEGYVRWRPDWLLAVLWGLLLAELAGLTAAANAALAGVCGAMLWKWWPRGRAPGLLWVLFWGLAWTPPAFLLRALAPAFPQLGRAPDHALLIGFCGTLLVAMVTRVTHGHSGRPLEMSGPAWLAFAGMQATAVLRIAAALRFEPGGLLLATGAVFAAGLAPWCAANFAIYTRARLDGKNG